MTLTAGAKESELLVWSSGEAEFAWQGPDGEGMQEHHDLRNVDELQTLLKRLTDWVVPDAD